MRVSKHNPKHDDGFLNRPDLTQILHFSPQLPIAAPPTQPDIAGSSAPQMPPSTKQLTPILRKEKRTITVSDTSESDSSSVRRSKRQLKKQKKFPKSSSIVEKIQNTEGYSAEMPFSNTNFIRVTKKPQRKMVCRPKSELTRDMTVLEAEEHSDSE